MEVTPNANPRLLAGLGKLRTKVGSRDPHVEEQIRRIYGTAQAGQGTEEEGLEAGSLNALVGDDDWE